MTVEQAIGVLAERQHLAPRAAFERLRKAARSRGKKVHDVAGMVVASVNDPTVPLPPELAPRRASRCVLAAAAQRRRRWRRHGPSASRRWTLAPSGPGRDRRTALVGSGPVARPWSRRSRRWSRTAVVVRRAATTCGPASLRLERGRDDPDAFYDEWIDVAGSAT